MRKTGREDGFMGGGARTLILGGTAEAVQLRGRISEHFADRISPLLSFAGVTSLPQNIPGPLRSGGFGGVEGLASYLRNNAVRALIVATHPHAANMPHNALAAATLTGTPTIRLLRPEWTPGKGDRWTIVTDVNAAAEEAMKYRRVFLAVGSRDLAGFMHMQGVEAVARVIEAPGFDAPDWMTLLFGRGPFDLEGERRLISDNGIEAVVAKNAGGDAGRSKLSAARDLGIPVIMIDRPPQPAMETVDTVDAVLDWLERALM